MYPYFNSKEAAGALRPSLIPHKYELRQKHLHSAKLAKSSLFLYIMFRLSGLARLFKSLVKSRPLLCSQINWRRLSVILTRPSLYSVYGLALLLLSNHRTPPPPISLSFTTVPSPQRLPLLIYEDWGMEVFLSSLWRLTHNLGSVYIRGSQTVVRVSQMVHKDIPGGTQPCE